MSNAPSHSSLNTLQVSDKLIHWTILISFCIHATAAWLIPNLSLEKEAKKEPLKVQIIQKPAPVAKPEPIKPPPKPKPKPKKKIKKKVKPKKVVKPKPLPKVAPTPLPVIEPEVIPEPEPLPEYVPPPVIAVEPPPEPTPDPTPPVPVASPPPPPGPTQSEVDSARAAYIGTLQAEMRKHKKYPRIAKTRGWQGRVVIEFSLDSQGRITNTQVIESSGHKALDNQAIKMAEKAAPFPLPPPLLRGKSFSVRVPVPFKLRQE